MQTLLSCSQVHTFITFTFLQMSTYRVLIKKELIFFQNGLLQLVTNYFPEVYRYVPSFRTLVPATDTVFSPTWFRFLLSLISTTAEHWPDGLSELLCTVPLTKTVLLITMRMPKLLKLLSRLRQSTRFAVT